MDGVLHLRAEDHADQHGRPVNLKTPPSRRFLSWVLRHKAAAVDYIKAAFQLSRLTVNVKYQGRTRKVVVTYSGRNAEVNIPLDTLLAP